MMLNIIVPFYLVINLRVENNSPVGWLTDWSICLKEKKSMRPMFNNNRILKK